MEKKAKPLQIKKGSRKLPTIQHNKSHVHLQPKLTDMLSSPSHLNDLRKLFYQYKSNANILVNSPYYTNRQQQHHLVTYIQANKHQPSHDQLKLITDRFALQPQLESQISHLPLLHLTIKLQAAGSVVELGLKARTVEELQVLLRRQFAVQQLKSNGFAKKVDSIGGFESVRPNPKLDFLLSQKNSVVPSGKYDLKPWFLEEVKGNVGLKDFRLIRCLGSGGFSLVYLARNRWRGDFHALKLIDKSFILESEREMIVQNERYVLGQLKSPFVTALNFSFQTKNHFVFAIQYCPGGELFYQLKKVRRMTEVQARFYFLEILIGLDYIHKKGIIYRDLKPENLLIGADGHIRIADFGLAKPLIGREAAYSYCGSPQYMAPEMLLKSGHKFTLDYYCLGALLYELVVGVPPYYSLNHDEIYSGILNEQLTFPSNTPLSAEIKSILLGLLEKTPSKRLGCLHGVKEILIHPWVGRVSRKDIEDKKMEPPFMPDLTNFNFDQSELSDKTKEITPKIQDDLRCPKFATHFNEEFYYADPNLLPHTTKPQKSIRAHLGRSLQKQAKTRSLMHRIASQRGKSK